MTPHAAGAGALRGLLAKATPGEWAWQVNKTSRSIELRANGNRIVMDFARWGMNGAQPRLRHLGGADLMVDAKAFAVDVPGREHHRTWFQTLCHPDAALICAARNELPTLLDENEALRARAEKAVKRLEALGTTVALAEQLVPKDARRVVTKDGEEMDLLDGIVDEMQAVLDLLRLTPTPEPKR